MRVDVHFGEMQNGYCIVTLKTSGSRENARLLASKIVKGGVVDTGDYQVYSDDGEIIGRLTKDGDHWEYISYNGLGDNRIKNGVSLSRPKRIGIESLRRMGKAVYSASASKFYKDPTIDNRLRIYYIDNKQKKLDRSIDEKRLDYIPEGFVIKTDGEEAWLENEKRLF